MLSRFLGVLLVCLGLFTSGCSSSGPSTDPSAPPASSAPSWAAGMATVREAQLPAQARDTLRLIDAGGPFPYDRDGVVFGNYEGELPHQKRGYYHEYTVPTPGERDRGARRLVTGSGGETYYTDDHYKSFKAVLR
jgi:ribonuclease T1